MDVRLRASALGLAAVVLWPRPCAAERLELDLKAVLGRAGEVAPAVVAARLRVEEARGNLAGASVPLRENPVLEGSAGRRTGPGAESVDFGVGLSQGFELGGKRGARVAGGEAEVAEASALAAEARRLVQREAVAAYFGVLRGRERERIARAESELAAALASAARRRFEAGDLPALDFNLAAIAEARARGAQADAEAEHREALGRLRALLGLEPGDEIEVRGDLAYGGAYELAALLERAELRPDVAAADAALRAAEAAERLGRASAWPDVGLGVSFEREGEEDIILGTASLTLPVFDHGQGLRASASARVRRLRAEREAAARTARNEIQSAHEALAARRAAVEAFARLAARGIDASEALVTRAYEAGEINLPDLLAVRRQVLEARTALVDHQFAASLAAIELEARAGLLP